MRALILAGGKGTRLRPLTFSIAKQLLPVANKPVIEYGLESIVESGIREIGIIVGDTASAIEQSLGDGSRWGVRLTYIPQAAPAGLADAVRTGHPFLGEDPFLMVLGDNLIKSPLNQLVDDFRERPCAASILLSEVPNPQEFGVAQLENGRVTKLIEKPVHPPSNFALVGVYLLSASIHESIENLTPSARGEYEITEAIQGLIDRNLEVRSHIVSGWWKDTGTAESMLEANRLILEDLQSVNRGTTDPASKIEGNVAIAEGTQIVRSVVRGPVTIGRNCHIEDSFIGPFTSLDDGCRVTQSEIENSILLADCEVSHITGRIQGSLIGRGSKVYKAEPRPRAVRLVLGDGCDVSLP